MPLSSHAIAVLALIVIALVLFSRDWIPIATSSLLVLVALLLGFHLFPYLSADQQIAPADLLAGFGNEALVTICALMIIGKGLEKTGALRPLVSLLSHSWGNRPALSLLLTLVCAAVLSAFLNNTPIVVMLLPVLISVSLRTAQPASGILLPMGLATLVGGMATTIGTSTNLLVVATAEDLGMERFSMFEFTLPVLVVGSFGILYLWLIAPRILPHRDALLEDVSPRIFDAQLHINADSFANGKTLSEVLDKTDRKMKVERIHRGADLRVIRLPTAELREGDRLLVRDTPDNLKDFEQNLGATLYSTDDISQPVDEQHPLTSDDQQLTEVVVTEGSLLYQRTLRDSRFADNYNLVIMAIHRALGDEAISSELADVVLQSGDVLLVQGSAERIAELRKSGRVLVLDATIYLPETRRAKRALLIMCAVVATAAAGILPISIGATSGVALMLLLRCIDWKDAASALSGSVILIVVVSLALGTALIHTGGAAYLAAQYVMLSQGLPIAAILGGLMLLMALMTNLVSNNATAVIGTPIAFNIASQLGIQPEPFVLAVLFGANMSYATPIGYQTNLLVFSAGGYRFSDFLRVGIPLTLIMWAGLLTMLMLIYQL